MSRLEDWRMCACGTNEQYGHPWGGWDAPDTALWCRGHAWEYPTNAEACRAGVAAFASGDEKTAFRLLGWRRGKGGTIEIPV